MIVRSALCSFAAALALAHPLPAAAQDLESGAPELARQRYLIGRDLYTAGDLSGAAQEFRTALDLFPDSPKLAFNLARTLERLDRVDEAVAQYQRYLALAPEAEDAPEVERLIAALQARQRSTLPTINFTSAPPGARVYLDGSAQPAGTTPFSTRLQPGTHAVRADKPGFASVLKTVDVQTGAANAVTFELKAVPAPSAPVVQVDGEQTAKWRPVAGWTALGLGVAAAAAGAAFHAAAFDAQARGGDLKVDDDEGRAALNGEIDSNETLAITGYAVGGALVFAGATLLFWPDAAEGTSAHLGLSVEASVLSLRGGW